jgi:protein FRG1
MKSSLRKCRLKDIWSRTGSLSHEVNSTITAILWKGLTSPNPTKSHTHLELFVLPIQQPQVKMVKALVFKGDRKPKSKKRKRREDEDSESKALAKATDNLVPEDDSWVTADNPNDPAGPVMVVLPTEPPTALACDAAGTVFALPIENMIEDEATTAEPHDVRMVWVFTRVAGTETVTFKTHHGKYLGADKTGTMSAMREAAGPEEGFALVPAPDAAGLFGLKTARDTFMAVDPKAKIGSATADKVVRADAEEIQFTSSIRIRMQARFKPKLKVAKEERAREKITRKELETMVGRKLEDEDVKALKRARREGNFHEKLLDVKVKGKHDKFA